MYIHHKNNNCYHILFAILEECISIFTLLNDLKFSYMSRFLKTMPQKNIFLVQACSTNNKNILINNMGFKVHKIIISVKSKHKLIY